MAVIALGTFMATPSTVSPGPTGDFAWKGLNWHKRAATEAGAPSNTGKWSAANVIGPDVSGRITLRITNPAGNSPTSSEFYTTRSGFGYGVYTLVTGTDLTNIHHNLVFGGLFTYDNSGGTDGVSNNEIDICETSAWGGSSVGVDNTYFYNSAGSKTGVVALRSPVDTGNPVQTHQMEWSAGRIAWATWRGTDLSVPPLHTRTVTTNVPVPKTEVIDINLWDFQSGGSSIPQTDVLLLDMSFVPAGTTVSTPPTSGLLLKDFDEPFGGAVPAVMTNVTGIATVTGGRGLLGLG
jgi:hypothetical protein